MVGNSLDKERSSLLFKCYLPIWLIWCLRWLYTTSLFWICWICGKVYFQALWVSNRKIRWIYNYLVELFKFKVHGMEIGKFTNLPMQVCSIIENHLILVNNHIKYKSWWDFLSLLRVGSVPQKWEIGFCVNIFAGSNRRGSNLWWW